MLLMASASRWPEGFYELLRIVVCGTAAYVVVRTWNGRVWPWVMAGIAILFNPVMPISFSRSDWQPIDLMTGFVMLAALWMMRPRNGNAA
jgi:hypothetical protein